MNNKNTIPNFLRLGVYTVIFIYLWLLLYNWLPIYGKFCMLVWYAGLLFQSGFHHSYSAHKHMTMSLFTEKIFYIGTWITQGASYLSAYAYGILHRIHHKHVDTEHDPHSPKYDKNQLAMMKRTARVYSTVFEKHEYEGKPVNQYTKNLPIWHGFDRFAHSWYSRIFWIALYIAVYGYIGVTQHVAMYEWIIIFFLFIGTCLMSPIHGLVINWYGHVWGYRNYETNDWSKNIGRGIFSLIMNFLFMRENFHNNHHAYQSSPNFAQKWWEYDFVYVVLLLLDAIGIIKLKRY